MGWTNTDTTELVAPSNVPFEAGNDVIGFGTSLPPELAAYKPDGVTPIQAAMVFYNSAWDPTATTPRVKFMFIGVSSNPAGGAAGISIGAGICNNPSVSTVAVVNGGLTIAVETIFSGVGSMTYAFNNEHDVPVTGLGPANVLGDPLLTMAPTALQPTAVTIVIDSANGTTGGLIQTHNAAGNTVTGHLP